MWQFLTHVRMLINQQFPPKPTWGTKDIPDLTGKVVLITGGNTGIGKESVKVLLQRNAKVYLAARNSIKAREAIDQLKEETGKEAIFLELDLASLEKVRLAAEEFLRREIRLDILINNGGVYMPPIEHLTDDGYDLTFGVNVIGHFYLTQMLLPVLISTTQDSPEKHARIITVSSNSHMFWGPEIRYDLLGSDPNCKKISPFKLYAQSKYGNILVAKELARRYADKGIVSISVHPGTIRTEILRYSSPLMQKFTYRMQHPISLGVLTQLFAATSPEARDLNGAYLVPWARVCSPRKDVCDPNTAAKLWDWLENQVKSK